MKQAKTIDVTPAGEPVPEPEQTQALAKIESGAVQTSNPYDMPVEQFKAGLERRGENRKALIDWVRASLVEGVDWGRIHTVKKSVCPKGRYCKNPSHFSKPVLYKPGAEKVCGMLGIEPTFPTLPKYEEAALAGIAVKTIILRCELLNGAKQIVATGVGGRTVEDDYGDINKSLKMAEKSAHIDATLRLGGLSEMFTQDLDDMPPREDAPPGDQSPPEGKSSTGGTKPPARPASAPARPHLMPTVESRGKMIAGLQAGPGDPNRDIVSEYFEKLGALKPGQDLETISLAYVPATAGQMAALQSMLRLFGNGERAEPAFPPHPELDSGPAPAATAQAASPPPVNGDEWFMDMIVPIPRKGQKRDEYMQEPDTIRSLFDQRHGDDEESAAARQRLWGFVEHFEPKGWEKRDGTKMPASEADKKFREALDAFADWFEKNHPDEKL